MHVPLRVQRWCSWLRNPHNGVVRMSRSWLPVVVARMVGGGCEWVVVDMRLCATVDAVELPYLPK